MIDETITVYEPEREEPEVVLYTPAGKPLVMARQNVQFGFRPPPKKDEKR